MQDSASQYTMLCITICNIVYNNIQFSAYQYTMLCITMQFSAYQYAMCIKYTKKALLH
jgi:hypothetical protein